MVFWNNHTCIKIGFNWDAVDQNNMVALPPSIYHARSVAWSSWANENLNRYMTLQPTRQHTFAVESPNKSGIDVGFWTILLNIFRYVTVDFVTACVFVSEWKKVPRTLAWSKWEVKRKRERESCYTEQSPYKYTKRKFSETTITQKLNGDWKRNIHEDCSKENRHTQQLIIKLSIHCV